MNDGNWKNTNDFKGAQWRIDKTDEDVPVVLVQLVPPKERRMIFWNYYYRAKIKERQKRFKKHT
ncbi:hypothetical protein [Prolixibacter sp. SD074]|uniref:hypothetical protein n=1 Tax=Prolixibacter sp. SD074 TaxID=2652391 RepID=UPI001299077B|nr:hypothetical protein [Prolixibacter sp. SD074]